MMVHGDLLATCATTFQIACTRFVWVV